MSRRRRLMQYLGLVHEPGTRTSVRYVVLVCLVTALITVVLMHVL